MPSLLTSAQIEALEKRARDLHRGTHANHPGMVMTSGLTLEGHMYDLSLGNPDYQAVLGPAGYALNLDMTPADDFYFLNIISPEGGLFQAEERLDIGASPSERGACQDHGSVGSP